MDMRAGQRFVTRGDVGAIGGDHARCENYPPQAGSELLSHAAGTQFQPVRSLSDQQHKESA